jgi:hypothetical protein
MLPQIGIDILRELNISKGSLLDPYCGAGSSFLSGLECGIKEMYGYDINPLAALLSKVKFTKIKIAQVLESRKEFRNSLFDFIKNERDIKSLPRPTITNIDFWFSKEVADNLTVIKFFIDKIQNKNIRDFFLLPFSETVRECSYARNNEFKLFRMKSEEILNFNPDVISMYFKKFDTAFEYYKNFYLPKLEGNISVEINHSQFIPNGKTFDVVLTSPPYGDSRTTVAYGQFSALSNEWLCIDYARKIDSMMMGGHKVKENIQNGIIADYISQIDKIDKKRSLEISAFYLDLEKSIKKVAKNVCKDGKVIYVVGNRTVKNIQLPTDQFIAEKFEENGFNHLITYERAISNKSMPKRNSPTNKKGKTGKTMLFEYIVVCSKTAVAA